MSMCRDMMPAWELRAALDASEAECTRLRAEIEKLRTALEMFACDCAVHERCAVPDNCRNFQASKALKLAARAALHQEVKP